MGPSGDQMGRSWEHMEPTLTMYDPGIMVVVLIMYVLTFLIHWSFNEMQIFLVYYGSNDFELFYQKHLVCTKETGRRQVSHYEQPYMSKETLGSSFQGGISVS